MQYDKVNKMKKSLAIRQGQKGIGIMENRIECLKEMLNYISQNTGYDKYVTFHSVINNSSFDKDTVLNLIYESEDEDLFRNVEHMDGAPDTGRIYSLSPDGRKMLENLNATLKEKIIDMLPKNLNDAISLVSSLKSILS